MEVMAVREDKLKKGTLLQVKRKCSPKVQPHIIDNSLYLVLEELPKTKSGAKSLLVAEFNKMAQIAMFTPSANIPQKDIYRINSDRFSLEFKSKKTLKKEIEKFKENFIKQQEQKQDAEIQNKFTERERSQMAYTPYLYAELAWYYAFKALDISIERKVEDLKKTTRIIKQLRNDFLYELKKKMTQPVLFAAQDKVKKALEDFSLDFFKFELTVKNEMEREYLGSKNNDMRAYAYMSMCCYEAQRRVDIANARLIEKRLGGIAEVVESYKYMRELYENIQQCVGERIPKTYIIDTSVKILEKNISKLTL